MRTIQTGKLADRWAGNEAGGQSNCQERQAGRKSAETIVVVWAWIVAVFCSLLCFLKLFSIGKESTEEAGGGARKKKSGKSSSSKKKKAGGRKRKASGKGKKSKGRDVSELDPQLTKMMNVAAQKTARILILLDIIWRIPFALELYSDRYSHKLTVFIN